MTSTDPPNFFDVAERKLSWLDERAGVLAANVANGDTPGYKPRDLAPFASFLSGSSLGLTTTNHADLSGRALPDDDAAPVEGSETGPDGNSVSIDQQMRLVAANDQDQSVVTTLYKKYVGMTELALGVSG